MISRAFVASAAFLALSIPQAIHAQATPRPAATARPAGTPPAQATPSAQPPLPNNATQLVMIRTFISALNHANQTNNYTVLYQMGSENFRKANTPQSLAQAFAPFRERRIGLNPALVLNPQLLKPVAVDKGRLQIQGFFPSQPMRIVFDMLFDPAPGGWQLANLNVSLAPIQQQQPAQQQQSAPQGQVPKKKPR